MSERWEGLGPAYAKLGIATAPEVIAARKAAAEVGYQAFRSAHLGGALRGALGFAVSADAKPLFDAMRAKDPTLDLEPSDREAGLLLSAVLAAEMKDRTTLGGQAALGLVAASFGGTRQSTTTPGLVAEAETCLANMQLAAGGAPKALAPTKVADDVTAALEAMGLQQSNYGQTLAPQTAMAAIRKVAEHATAAHAAAASQANVAIAYARRIEEELRTYWWVVGGWSDDLRRPFGGLALGEAAIRAGAELAAMTTFPLGVFAAPALLDKVLRSERKGRLAKSTLTDAVEQVDAARRGRFKTAVASGDLSPVTLALALSSDAGPDEDWRPRFRRITRLSADVALAPLDLAVQLHREVLLSRVLQTAK